MVLNDGAESDTTARQAKQRSDRRVYIAYTALEGYSSAVALQLHPNLLIPSLLQSLLDSCDGLLLTSLNADPSLVPSLR